MASITIRQLDEDLKQRLRLRAARHGRSMEDEARTILRAAAAFADGTAEPGGAQRRRRGKLAAQQEPARDPPASSAAGARRVVLIIGGGIAAYKALDLIRRLKERGLLVRCILTAAAQKFVTPLSAGALSGERVFTDLFDPASEFDVGHVRLAREADLVVVAPATADLMAKMAGGHADDLACAVLLATGCTVLLAPAMNPHMWQHPATRRNLARLVDDGVAVVGPNAGEMAEADEAGVGRMAEPLEIAGSRGAAYRGRRRRSARRQARDRHVRPDPRADRSGALHRQPLVGQAGPRHRCGRRGRRRRGDAGVRPGQRARSAPASRMVKVVTAQRDACAR